MIQILKKEINSFFNSLIAYLVMGVFLISMGLLMWVFPDTSILNYGYADMSTLFGLAPYVFMFLIPAITMRSFAEEKKGGTLELLFTRPLTDWQIILGKYLAGWIIVILTLVPTLIYYFSIYQLGSPTGNIDSAGVAGSYIGLVLLGALFTSIGIFASAITENQIIAFIIAAFLCFIFFEGFGALSSLNIWGKASDHIAELGILYHYQAMSRGLIDSRNLTYFLSVIVLMLLFTHLILGSRKW